MIVLIEDFKGLRRGIEAIDALMFATVIENQAFYSNSTTFTRHIYDLSKQSDILTEFRSRMHGTLIDAYPSGYRIHVRPEYAEQYHRSANLKFASALAIAQRRREGLYLKRALETLRLAMSDSPEMTQSLQHSLFAKAATLVVFTSDLKNDGDKQLVPRVNKLLKPCFAGRRRLDNASLHGPSWIRKAWIAVRWERNGFWHARGRGGSRARFTARKQRLVAPMMIALRMVYSLTIARLLEMGVISADNALISDVAAVAEWIASLGPHREQGLSVPVRPTNARDSKAMKTFSEQMMAWNSAAKAANDWGPFRLDASLNAGVRDFLRKRRSGG
jgi:hypothetical protein